MAAMVPRAGKEMTALARALGTKRAELDARIEELGGGPRRLSELGADRSAIGEAVRVIIARPELQLTPDPPDEAEIRALIESAW
jgi:alcohol dehydrogenase class IV